MLSDEDIQKIRGVIREEVENEIQVVKNELQADMTMSRMRIQTDIQDVKDRVKNVELNVNRMHKDLKSELKMVSHFLDKENMSTLKRVEKIEKKLEISNQ